MPSRRTFPILALFLILTASVAQIAHARDQVSATGSAIAPVFSLQHSSMRPGEAVVLVACVANGNPDARRHVEPGDTLSFEGTGVTLIDCEVAPAEDRGGGFAPSDWTCAVDGAALRLTFTGLRRTWPRGEAICARVHALAPMTSATVLPVVEAGNFGAWTPAQPSVLFLSVDAEIGSVGPTGPVGPVGPQGPAGPRGPSGVGDVRMAVSTSEAHAWECEPATALPGLDLTVSVDGGSRILAHVDAVGHPCSTGLHPEEDRPRGILLLELDGAIVVRHRVTNSATGSGASVDSAESPTSLSWLSDPLGEGAHRLRLLFEFKDSDAFCNEKTSCLGGAPGSDVEAHLIALELRAP